MDASVQWWELVMPRTMKGCSDAHVRIENGRMKVAMMSDKARKIATEAMQPLRWARVIGKSSSAFPWRRVPQACKPGKPANGRCQACALEILYGASSRARKEGERFLAPLAA